MVFELQLGDPSDRSEPSQMELGKPGTWQQPKQSQPLGVSGLHTWSQADGWLDMRLAQSFN